LPTECRATFGCYAIYNKNILSEQDGRWRGDGEEEEHNAPAMGVVVSPSKDINRLEESTRGMGAATVSGSVVVVVSSNAVASPIGVSASSSDGDWGVEPGGDNGRSLSDDNDGADLPSLPLTIVTV